MSKEELFEYCKQASDEITRLQNKIDKAIKEIECELEYYDGSNENMFPPGEWLEMETDTYIETLNNFIKILKGEV